MNFQNNMTKTGFTLSEVLITLGIIGVVAAITIPGLMTNYRKHVTATTLEKSISTLNQTIKLSENENGELETWDKSLPQEEFIDKYFRPYIKIMQTCNPITKCGYKSQTPWKNLNGRPANDYGNPNHRGRTPFIAMDGILYTFGFINDGGTAEVDNDKIIIIDINNSRGPNQFGKDIFFLYRKEEASIYPYGADKSSKEIRNDCSKNGRGFYCAAWIRENGWKIPSDYPWN